MQPVQDPNLRPAPPPEPTLRSMEPVVPPGSTRPALPPAKDYTPPPPAPHRSKRRGGWGSKIATLLLFLAAPAIALFIAAFVVQSYQVDGQSMEPTLQDNDRLVVDKWQRSWARITHNNYIPNRGNIIIFNQGGLDFAGSASKQLIKRVIGLPGERVVVANGKITIYNKSSPSGFNPDVSGGYKLSTTVTAGSVDITLGVDEIFVSGDNRANSEDSRYFGPIKAKQIVGKLGFRIVPLDKAQKF
ncbi:signal peptidase I [Candidatus Saccharibacteria bacterium]|nr:signal peptidase I [Candidatus Saccharibacteria bacterium]